jgi:glycosyltransferase involved in cell wall biosynthesis
VSAAERPGILIVAPTAELTFVAQDVEILSRAYRVDVLARHEHPSLRQLLPALVARLRTGRYALVYLWFAEPHDSPWVVLLARLFGVKCAIAAGGYDVAALPALGYGALADRRGRWRVKAALRGASAVFPTSDLLADEVRRLGRTRDVRVIYPGVDCARFAPGRARERLVVTVGTVGPSTWRLKGLDVFARCSRLVPDARFVVIGPAADEAVARELRAAGGENLALAGRRVSPAEMADWFRRAAVYAQLSARESFGLALAEAMAAGCVPVVADAGFMPRLVGDTGFVVPHGNAAAAAEAIRAALACEGGAQARERVRRLYSLERRTRALLEGVGGLVGEAGP